MTENGPRPPSAWTARARLAILYAIVVASFSLFSMRAFLPSLPPIPEEEARAGLSNSPRRLIELAGY